MKYLLDLPGHLSSPGGGQRLRQLIREESIKLEYLRLPPFAVSVFAGDFDSVKKTLESNPIQNLAATHTAFKTGYASLAILGAQRVVGGPRRHLETLEYLLSNLTPLDVEDIVGFTALHHATMTPGTTSELSRCLLRHGADVNHRNRYGEVCILGAMQLNLVPTIDLLMEYNADLDLADADGWTARNHFINCGPQVVACISKWIKKRDREETLPGNRHCITCGASPTDTKTCSRCKVSRYCSIHCQALDWQKHKKTCQPFDKTTTVTLHPHYGSERTIPVAELTRSLLGYPTLHSSWMEKRTRTAHIPKHLEHGTIKPFILKVQVPYFANGCTDDSNGDLLLYTRRRDFACTIRRSDDPASYDVVSHTVRTKGTAGAKAYFAAELHSREKLIIKISQVLGRPTLVVHNNTTTLRLK
ncbi:ankyrin repeat-containing domain protein [Mycena galericulata]|nr:ankyrin repeat-containing domain protein [Mycena galericulata]